MSVRNPYLNTAKRFGPDSPKYRPITDVERHRFYRKGDSGTGKVSWVARKDRDGLVGRLRSVRSRPLALLVGYAPNAAARRGKKCKRGDRIDIPVDYFFDVDARSLRRKLSRIDSRYGVQFVTFTDRGLAFIKL